MSEREIKSLISSLTSVCSLYQQIIADMATVLEMVVDTEPDSPLRKAVLECRDVSLAKLELVQRLVDMANADAIRSFGISLKTPETLH